MAIMLNSRSNVYENIFFSASQPPDSSTILQPAGIAAVLPSPRDIRHPRGHGEIGKAELLTNLVGYS